MLIQRAARDLRISNSQTAERMLAVVGSGEYLPAIALVDRQLIDLFDTPPRVVCMPTAAGLEGDATIDGWMHRGVDHFNGLGVAAEPVRVWDRASAHDAELAERVARADFVYLSGGNPRYLHGTLEGSPAWRAIMDVVDRGGLLAGCSAGAMVQGEDFMGFPRKRQGFGLWPGIHIVPHFDEIPSVIASALRVVAGRRTTVVGVPANTALVEQNGHYRVIGQAITVWTAKGKHRYAAGELPPSALHE